MTLNSAIIVFDDVSVPKVHHKIQLKSHLFALCKKHRLSEPPKVICTVCTVLFEYDVQNKFLVARASEVGVKPPEPTKRVCVNS